MTSTATSIKDPDKVTTVALAAQVRSEFWAEFDAIRQQRGERFISDTVRVALEEFALRHWAERIGGEAA